MASFQALILSVSVTASAVYLLVDNKEDTDMGLSPEATIGLVSLILAIPSALMVLAACYRRCRRKSVYLVMSIHT